MNNSRDDKKGTYGSLTCEKVFIECMIYEHLLSETITYDAVKKGKYFHLPIPRELKSHQIYHPSTADKQY